MVFIALDNARNGCQHPTVRQGEGAAVTTYTAGYRGDNDRLLSRRRSCRFDGRESEVYEERCAITSPRACSGRVDRLEVGNPHL